MSESFPNGLQPIECEYQAPDPRAGICDSGAGNVVANMMLLVVAITIGIMM